MFRCEDCGTEWTNDRYGECVATAVMLDDMVADAIGEGFCPACGNTECVVEE